MSVEYSSGIAKGIIINGEMLEKACAKVDSPNFSLAEDLYEHDLLISTDCYTCDGDYVIGYTLFETDCGMAEYISTIPNKPTEKDEFVVQVYNQYFLDDDEEPATLQDIELLIYCRVY